MTHRTRLQVEALEDRRTPSASFEAPPALVHLSAALEQVGVNGPPIRVAPAFALNYGSGWETLPALDGLVKAGIHGPPISPVFFGLAEDRT